jgi:hypothetical protein
MLKSLPVKLYLLMRSSFVLVNEVPAGHLCAVQSLEDIQYKTATLCESPCAMPLSDFLDKAFAPLSKSMLKLLTLRIPLCLSKAWCG